jgi:hypothetical protein
MALSHALSGLLAPAGHASPLPCRWQFYTRLVRALAAAGGGTPRAEVVEAAGGQDALRCAGCLGPPAAWPAVAACAGCGVALFCSPACAAGGGAFSAYHASVCGRVLAPLRAWLRVGDVATGAGGETELSTSVEDLAAWRDARDLGKPRITPRREDEVPAAADGGGGGGGGGSSGGR